MPTILYGTDRANSYALKLTKKNNQQHFDIFFYLITKMEFDSSIRYTPKGYNKIMRGKIHEHL